MWMPVGMRVPEEIKNAIIELIRNDSDVKAELTKQIKNENEKQRIHSGLNKSEQSYASLTSGDVNMQLRMAASGYDVYGKTIITGNKSFTNKNAYKKMKNQIKYGSSPRNIGINRGQRDIT